MTKGTSEALGKSTCKVKCPPTPKIILINCCDFQSLLCKGALWKSFLSQRYMILGENHPIPVEPDPSIAVCFTCVLFGVFSPPLKGERL